MTQVLQRPLPFMLALSGSVHLGLALALAMTATSQSKQKIEISFIEATAPARQNKRKTLELGTQGTRALPEKSEAAIDDSVATEEVDGTPSPYYDVYASEVARELNRHKVYPEISLKLRQQGRVKVRFHVDRSGSVLMAEILEKSPYDPLNSAAKRLIEEIRSFRPFPEEVKATSMLFEVPIEYTM